MLTWYEFDEPNSGLLAHHQIIHRSGALALFEPTKAPVAVVMTALGLLLGASSLKTASSVALSKLARRPIKLQPDKASGFFTASKANLRNIP